MEYTSKSEKYYDKNRPEMQALFPSGSKNMLDVGCGRGTMAIEIKQKYDIEVWGIEFMEEEALVAQKKLDFVIIDSIENGLVKLPDDYFDVIYFADVLEHLQNPDKILLEIKEKLTDNGVIISSIPNVRYHKVFRNYIFKKDWKYEKAGVMDFTHLRFFTSKSIIRMYEEQGLHIQKHFGINRTKSIMPYLYNIILLFTGMDIFFVQFATIAGKKQKF